MNRNRLFVGLLGLLLLGWGFGSAELHGQLGGFIKKRVKDVVKPSDKGTETTTESGSNAAPRFTENVLELNVENLAKLEKALNCEKDFRAGVEARYAKMQSEQDYDNCLFQKVPTSPEALAISEDNSTDFQKKSQQLLALQEKICGKRPDKSRKPEELRGAKDQGAKCGGLTLSQYSIAAERITPFCNSGGQAKVKSFGDMYYVYTQTEMTAIQPKCATLTSLISDVNGPIKK